MENRPSWFSKKLALHSFINSYNLFSRFDSRKTQFWMGIDKHQLLSKDELQFIGHLTKKYHFDIDYLTTGSNTKSYLRTLEEAVKAKSNDIILLAEDDYLWLPEAVTEMVIAINTIKDADYITPYDHPVRYDDNYFNGADLLHWNNKIYLAGNRHYRPQESTCMTFMTRGKTLKEDLNIHKRYSSNDRNCPNDRELFRHLQKLKGKAVNKKIKRLLIGPMPSLATHVHLPYMAPIINWELIAKNNKI